MNRSFTITVLMLTLLTSCNNYTYRFKSKKKIQEQKPSVVLLDRIIEFREAHNTWPFSKEEFIRAGRKYKEAFDGFPYEQTIFKVIDNNRMTFYFYDNRKDLKKREETGKEDLNSYRGEVRFYKEKDNFIWKIKMY